MISWIIDLVIHVILECGWRIVGFDRSCTGSGVSKIEAACAGLLQEARSDQRGVIAGFDLTTVVATIFPTLLR